MSTAIGAMKDATGTLEKSNPMFVAASPERMCVRPSGRFAATDASTSPTLVWINVCNGLAGHWAMPPAVGVNSGGAEVAAFPENVALESAIDVPEKLSELPSSRETLAGTRVLGAVSARANCSSTAAHAWSGLVATNDLAIVVAGMGVVGSASCNTSWRCTADLTVEAALEVVAFAEAVAVPPPVNVEMTFAACGVPRPVIWS